MWVYLLFSIPSIYCYLGVGKSSIALRYIHDEFNENTESTIGG